MDTTEREKGQRAYERLCIDVTSEDEVHHWAAKFGCTPEELRAAVRLAGTLGSDVETHLSAKKRPHRPTSPV